MPKPHSVLFQGKRCTEGWYIHRSGTGADSGQIRMHIEDARSFLIRPFERPFVPAGGIQVLAQPFSSTLTEGFQATTQRIPARGGGPTPQDDRTTIMGNLVFDSRDSAIDENPQDSNQQLVVIPQVFLTESSFHEIMDDIITTKDNEHGVISVDLTDIRSFWPKYGAVTGDFNWRSEEHIPKGKTFPGVTGRYFYWDTVKKDGGPWSLFEILQFVLKHLPGSYDISSAPPRTRTTFPENIHWRWEPAIKALEALLNTFGLEIHPNLDENANVTLTDRNIVHTEDVFSVSPGLQINMPAPNSKLRGQRAHPRPAVVTVVGEPVHQNVTRGLIPVMLDLDNKIKPVETVLKSWGITMDQALAQLSVEEHRQYEDKFSRAAATIPSPPGLANLPGAAQAVAGVLVGLKLNAPQRGRSSLPRLTGVQRELFKACFCKWFAIPGAAWNNPEDSRHPDLPIGERITTETGEPTADLVAAEEVAKSLGFRIPKTELADGTGKQKIRLAPPRIFAHQIVQRLMHTSADMERILTEIISQLAEEVQRMKEYVRESLETEMDMPRKRQLISKFETSGDKLTLEDILNEIPDAYRYQGFDTNAVKTDLNPEIPTGGIDSLDTTKKKAAVENRKRILQLFDDIERKFQDALDERLQDTRLTEKKLNEWRAVRDKLRKQSELEDHEKRWWVCWYGEVPAGKYAIDTQRGLVMFNDPVFIPTPPMSPNRAHLRGGAIGFAHIAYGVEHDMGEPQDITFASFVNDKGTVKLVGIGTPVFDTPYVVPMSNLKLYVDALGNPFNSVSVIEEAEEAARGLLLMPTIESSIIYKYKGFWPIDLGHNGVSYVSWNSEDTSLTEIGVNILGRFGPKMAQAKAEADWIATVSAFSKLPTFTRGRYQKFGPEE